jgi:Ca2+-binding EF-hand superfamily protein
LGKGYLNWEEFFRALKLISSKDLKDKIELFFYIVDADGNGRFSFPEIKDICKLSLSKFENQPSYEVFREELADFFAKYIFKLMGKDPEEDEIPATDFKQAIYTGTQEQRDILAMFCCADAQVMENKQK